VYKRGSMVLSLNPTSKTKTVSLDALKTGRWYMSSVMSHLKVTRW